MTRYEYEAEKWNGEKVKGTLDAKSQAEVKVRVKNMGYKLVAIREFTSNQGKAKNETLQSLSLKEKIDFTQTFLTLNKAGVPIIESLIFIEKDAASRQVRLLAQEIKRQIKS